MFMFRRPDTAESEATPQSEVIASLVEQVEKLTQQVTTLTEQVARLTEQVSANSSGQPTGPKTAQEGSSEDLNEIGSPRMGDGRAIEPAQSSEIEGDVLAKYRAKLFRFESSTGEWRECGTGDVRLLQHKETKKVRVLMRRDKTLKICANHYVTKDMKLQPNVGSDRSWVWKAVADVSDGEPAAHEFAIRFPNKEIACEFKTAFEAAQAAIPAEDLGQTDANNAEDSAQDEVTKKLAGQVTILTEQVAKLAELVATLARRVPLAVHEQITDESQGENLPELVEQLDTRIMGEPSSAEEEVEQAVTASEHTFTMAPKESDDQSQTEQISEHTGENQTDNCIDIEDEGHVEQVATTAELGSTMSHEEHESTAQVATLVEDVSNSTHGESEVVCQPELEFAEHVGDFPPEYYKEPNDMDRMEEATLSESALATVEDVADHMGRPEQATESIGVVSHEACEEPQGLGQIEQVIEHEQPEGSSLVAGAAPKQAILPASEDGSTAPSELIQPSVPEEEIIAEHRGRLFRFEGNPLEWKALGSHDICLLQHKVTKKVRVLITRDKAAEASLNYRVTKETRLQPNTSSNRSWVWNAIPDTFNDDMTSETIAVRFANKEVADGFKVTFEVAQAAIPDENQPLGAQDEANDATHGEVMKKLASQVAILMEQVAKLAELIAMLAEQAPPVAQRKLMDEEQATNATKIAEEPDTKRLGEPATAGGEVDQVAATLERTLTTAPNESDDQDQSGDLPEPMDANPVDDRVEPESKGHGPQVATSTGPDSTMGHVEGEDIELPDISSEYTDSDDEDSRSGFPGWTKGDNLMQALKVQELFNPDALFGPTQRPTLRDLFGAKYTRSRKRKRTSSTSSARIDRITVREEIEYAHQMGYSNQ